MLITLRYLEPTLFPFIYIICGIITYLTYFIFLITDQQKSYALFFNSLSTNMLKILVLSILAPLVLR